MDLQYLLTVQLNILGGVHRRQPGSCRQKPRLPILGVWVTRFLSKSVNCELLGCPGSGSDYRDSSNIVTPVLASIYCKLKFHVSKHENAVDGGAGLTLAFFAERSLKDQV